MKRDRRTELCVFSLCSQTSKPRRESPVREWQGWEPSARATRRPRGFQDALGNLSCLVLCGALGPGTPSRPPRWCQEGQRLAFRRTCPRRPSSSSEAEPPPSPEASPLSPLSRLPPASLRSVRSRSDGQGRGSRTQGSGFRERNGQPHSGLPAVTQQKFWNVEP